MRTEPVGEMYLETRRYRGSDGTVVELDVERHGERRRHYHWWWRVAGTEEWYGGDGLTKLEALVQAANSLGMTAAQWDPKPEPAA